MNGADANDTLAKYLVIPALSNGSDGVYRFILLIIFFYESVVLPLCMMFDVTVCFRQQTVEKQMSRMPQFIKEYHARLEKVAEKERQQEAKKRELLEEARDYFGYSIDTRDPRFEEMKLRKEEEEKKLAKKKKKEARALRAQGLFTPK